MSAALIVTKEKKQTNKAMIDKPEFTIGRSVKCDLVLDDDNISRTNAVVRADGGGGYVLRDNGSRNGTFHRGKPITGEVRLKDGDKFIIGPYELTFISEDSGIDADATRAYDDNKMQQMREDMAAQKALPGHLAVQLYAENGPLKGNRFKNWAGKLNLGRHIDNEVVLPDDAVSNFHASIRFENDGYYIEDLGSANGTFVGGLRVTKHKLKAKEEIRVGTSKFTFTCVDLAAARKRRTIMLSSFIVFMALLVGLKVYQKMNPPKYVEVMAKVEALVQQGNCEEAMPLIDVVLGMKSNHQRARQLKQSCTTDLQLVKLQDEVVRRASEEDFQGALDICREALRIKQGHPWYAQRESILKKVIEAKEAVNSRNWSAAIIILEEAGELFPQSKEIRTLLTTARVEEENERRLVEARRLHESQDLQSLVEAKRLLETINRDSGYADEVERFLPEVRARHQFEHAVYQARTAYQSGNLAEAESQANFALKLNEDDSRAAEVKSKILRLREPYNLISSVRGDNVAGGVAEMTALVAACDEILEVERDAQNGIHQRAAQLKNQLVQRMAGFAQEMLNRGTQLQAQNNWKGAALAYGQALEADPSFTPARQRLDEVSSIVTKQVKTLYQEAVIHIDLGDKEAARTKLQSVLEQTWPEHEYNRKALAKIKFL